MFGEGFGVKEEHCLMDSELAKLTIDTGILEYGRHPVTARAIERGPLPNFCRAQVPETSPSSAVQNAHDLVLQTRYEEPFSKYLEANQIHI